MLSRLIPDFATVVAPNPGPMTLGGTNTYVVGRDPAYVVDGPDHAGHLEAVRAEGEARGGIAGVVLTHGHADHSAGVRALGAPLLWGEVGEGDESTAVFGAGSGVSGSRCVFLPPIGRKTQFVCGPSRSAPSLPFSREHAPDHFVFVYRDVCFCGDLILGEGRASCRRRPAAARSGTTWTRSAGFAPSTCRCSLQGMGRDHGPPAKVDEYIAHREEREARLAEALDAGERSRELLDAAWDDVPGILKPAAAMAMQAHLEKLEAEGRLEASELAPWPGSSRKVGLASAVRRPRRNDGRWVVVAARSAPATRRGARCASRGSTG